MSGDRIPEPFAKLIEYLKERQQYFDTNTDDFRKGYRNAILDVEIYIKYNKSDHQINSHLIEAYTQGIEDANRMRNR